MLAIYEQFIYQRCHYVTLFFPQHKNFSRHFTFHRRTTNWIKWIRFDFMCNACFIFMFTLPSWGQWTVLARTRCLHISLILFVTVYKWRNHHLPFSSSKLAEVQYNPPCRYVNEWWIFCSCISKKCEATCMSVEMVMNFSIFRWMEISWDT